MGMTDDELAAWLCDRTNELGKLDLNAQNKELAESESTEHRGTQAVSDDAESVDAESVETAKIG
jgi:hypothetical protein